MLLMIRVSRLWKTTTECNFLCFIMLCIVETDNGLSGGVDILINGNTT